MAIVGKRVAVIGAGAGGICAAKHLLAVGAEVTVFELGSYVGGLWVYDNDNGRSPAYGSLHINSEPKVTHYLDYPFPDGTTLFPTHRDVHAYLESYASHFRVREHIRFNEEVTSVVPDKTEGGWIVTAARRDERFDEVVVATGHQWAPAHPSFAADFTGDYFHSKSYRTPEQFRDHDVLVIGVGNSGLDIAADISTVAARTVVAVRSPVLIMPRMMFGVPTSRLLAAFNKPYVPWPVLRTWQRILSWIAHGRMERWGMQTPKTRTHPASNPTFMAQVFYGRIEIKPGVSAVRGTQVEFTDGTVVSVDTMIAATGYEVELPFLHEDINPVRGRRLEAYKRVVHVDCPGLYFVGFFNVSGGANIRMMDVQARWVAALVAGAAVAPSPAAMRADLERERRTMAKRYPAAERYGLELDPVGYPREIMQELQRTGPPTRARSSEPASWPA